MVAIRYAHSKWKSFFKTASALVTIFLGFVGAFFVRSPKAWYTDGTVGVPTAYADVPSKTRSGSGGVDGGGSGGGHHPSDGSTDGGDGGDGDGGGGGGGGCFAYDTKFKMADGSIRAIQDIQIGNIMLGGGRVFILMKGDGYSESWYLINGVKVTGGHPVLDADGIWRRVEESRNAIPTTADQYYWTLINSRNLMVAENGTIFSDWIEVGTWHPVRQAFWKTLINTLNSDRSPAQLATMRSFSNVSPIPNRIIFHSRNPALTKDLQNM